LVNSTLRILRCNQLFDGGIDYPIVEYKIPKLLSLCNGFDIKVKYWFVPRDEKCFFVLRDFGF